MKKKIFSLMFVFVMVLSLAACGTKNNEETSKPADANTGSQDTAQNTENGDNSLQYILDKGTFVLGLDDNFPPMGFRDDANNIVGFDVDLAKAVCEKLGVELVLQPIDWTAKEQELNTKNIDCIWNGFSITEERKANLSLSMPYMENSIAFVVRNDSTFSKMEDLAGKKVGVQSGSSGEKALDDAADFKSTLGEVNGFKDYVTALMDLETGNSDAIVMDSVFANYMITDAGKDFRLLEDALVPEEYAIGFRKGELALTKAVEDALKELKAEGTVAKIATEWFGSDTTIFE